ncbi:hypothetical protein FQA39_LY03694 [Lamprigera yunnana]|nr:hypothetical protein FQA39_LY03694 [Lamprigera yunnana]
MKSIVLVICILFRGQLSLQEDFNIEKEAEGINHCMKEANVSPDLLKKAYEEDDFGTDESLKCYRKCIMIRENKISKDGIVNLESIKQYHSKSLDVIKKCEDISSDSSCEYAFQIHKCMNELKNYGFS